MNAAQHTVLYSNSSVPQFLRPVVPPVHHSASNGQTAHCSRDTGGRPTGLLSGETAEQQIGQKFINHNTWRARNYLLLQLRAICGEESSGSGPGRASDRRQTALIVGECHEVEILNGRNVRKSTN
ncbi:hypothetical protein J6590_004294 [Homalodisca vitripennis]|nr:hypothetical protein J6590_004294 [Homalodisca vitripennis]